MNATSRPARMVSQIGISLVLVIVLSVAGVILVKQGKTESASVAPDQAKNSVTVTDHGIKIAEIETSVVSLSTIQGDLHASGQVMYPPDETVKISPRLQGRIERVFVKVGDHVTKDQPLAVLTSLDASTARTTALQNENRLRFARLNLDRQERLYRLGTPDVSAAEAALGQAKVATLAARDTLERTKYQAKIGGFTEKPLEDAENALVTANSTLSQAKSDLAQAQRDCDRKAKLFEIGVGSKSDLDVALNTLEKARENAKADEESVRIAKQAFTREQKASQSNLYADNQVKQMESAYRQAVLQEAAAEKSLRLAKASIFRDLEQAKSDYQSAKYDFQNSQKALTLLGKPSKDGELSITSPISGVITERNVNQGQIVDQSQMTPWQMFTVSNSKKIWVSMDIYEKDISSVKDGASLSIRVGAVPNREFSGKIFRISPTIDSKSRTVKVQAEIPNPNGLLKDGEFAEVTVLLGIGHQGIAIPISAIVRDGESDIVFVFDGKNYIKRTVRLSGQQGDRYQISDGLRVGDRVVTKGAIFLGTQANGG